MSALKCRIKKLVTILIDTYINLQRVLSSDNMKSEAEYQLRAVKVKLESMDIAASSLDKQDKQ